MPLAAHFGYPSLARPSLCALEALRWIVSGETMSTPVGRAQRFGQHCCNFLRARRTGFYHGVGAPCSQGAPTLCRGRMPQGVSYVRYEREPANLYIRKHNTHQSTSGALPCTIEAITRSGTDTPSSRPTGPFFTQRRGTGFLGSSQVRSSANFALTEFPEVGRENPRP